MTNASQASMDESTLLEDETLVISESCSTLNLLFCNGVQRFYQNEHDDPFELADEFQEVCCDYIKVFRDLKKKRPTLSTISQDQLLSTNLLKMIRIERNTWRLAYILFKNRLNIADEDMAVDEGIQSDVEVAQNLLDRNKELRQMQLIIDWLEKNELDDMQEEDQPRIEFYSEGDSTHSV